MGEYRKVIAIGSDILDRFRSTRNSFIRYQSTQVLCSKVAAHHGLGEYKSVIACVEDLVDWIGEQKGLETQKMVAWALNLAAEAQERTGNVKGALRLVEVVLKRSGKSRAPELQVHLADALVQKANIVSAYEEDDGAALEIYNQIIDRYRESESPELKTCVVATMMNRALVQGRLGDFEGELVSYEAVIERGSKRGAWEKGSAAGLACLLKAMRLAEIGRADEARVACDEIDRRLGSLSEEWEFWVATMARGARALALMVSGDGVAAIESFRAAFAVCPTGHQAATSGMIRLVRNLIKAGAKESDLLGVLLSDRGKSQAFEPLVVALHMRMGEAVRAPAELLEVAADLCKRIESESVTGVLWDV